MPYHPAWNHYGVGADEADSELALVERRETRADAELELQRQRVGIERESLKAARQAAFWEGLQTVAIVAIPIAAFFGFDRWFKAEMEKKELTDV